jgi:hypothetical protein
LGALLAPAKRASVIMFIVGGLMLPCGALFGLLGAVDFSQLPAQQAAQIQAMEQQLTAAGMTLKQLFITMGLFTAIPGVLLIVLGVMVRGGGMGSVVTSLIFCGLLGLLAALGLVSNLAQGNACGGALFLGVLASLIAAVVFLFQAAGRSAQVSAYRAGGGMYSQAYGQPGYPQQPQYPSQQPQVWQQPGAGGWGQPPAQGWGQVPPPPPPPPPPDRQG